MLVGVEVFLDEGALEHFLIDVDVALGGDGGVKALLAFGHDAGDVACFGLGGEAVELHGLVDGPAEAAGVVGVEAEAVAGVVFEVEGGDGVVEAAGVADDGEGAV